MAKLIELVFETWVTCGQGYIVKRRYWLLPKQGYIAITYPDFGIFGFWHTFGILSHSVTSEVVGAKEHSTFMSRGMPLTCSFCQVPGILFSIYKMVKHRS